MKLKLSHVFVLFFLLCVMALSQANASEYNENWPTWRGPLFSGEAVKGSPPTVWSEKKNIKWKTPIPGKGLSTPVIWGDHIFITSAISLDKKASEEVVQKLKEEQPDWLKNSGSGNVTEFIQQFVVY